MIEIPYTENYHENQERCKRDEMPCIVCGRPVKSSNPAMVRVFWGSHIVTDKEAEEIIAKEGDGGDLLNYPIGPNCLKNHPEIQPYAKKPKRKLVRYE